MPRTFSICGSFHAAATAANPSREQCGPSNNQLSCQPCRQYTQRRIVLYSMLGIHFDSLAIQPALHPPPTSRGFYQHPVSEGETIVTQVVLCGQEDFFFWNGWHSNSFFNKRTPSWVGYLWGSRAVVMQDFFFKFLETVCIFNIGVFLLHWDKYELVVNAWLEFC